MNNTHFGLLLILVSISGCAHAPPPPAPTPKTEHGEQPEVAHPETIRVLCALYSMEGSGSGSCTSVVFGLENEDGEEIARKNPDASGTLEFPVPKDKAFRVRPHTPGSWTIEWIPSGDLHAGDTVRIVLRH